GAQKATRLNESVAELDAQISRVTARVPFVEKLEGRLDALSKLSSDIDLKVQDQLNRRADVEALRAACDSLTAQLVDAELKLQGVRALQVRLVPLVGELNGLRREIEGVGEQIDQVRLDETAVVEQERRLVELVAAGRRVASAVAERSRQIQGLSEGLVRGKTSKHETSVPPRRVQDKQRDTVSHIQASEDQLGRAEKMFKLLEQRRTQIAFGEKKMAVVESRLAEIKTLADELEKHIQSIASREVLVNAVKAEVDA